MLTTCAATTRQGTPCRMRLPAGATYCRNHDPNPDARSQHREQSKRGGEAKAYGALTVVEPMAADLAHDVDLGTAKGGRALLAVALRRLADLPFDVRIAYAVSQLVPAQRAQIESADLEERLSALEAALASKGTAP
jgi:hypothetical protein